MTCDPKRDPVEWSLLIKAHHRLKRERERLGLTNPYSPMNKGLYQYLGPSIAFLTESNLNIQSYFLECRINLQAMRQENERLQTRCQNILTEIATVKTEIKSSLPSSKTK